MKRYMMWVGILLLAGTLVSCGGGGGGGGGSPTSATPADGGTPNNTGGTPPSSGGTPPNTGGTPPNTGGVIDTATHRFEENDATSVTRTGVWDPSDPHAGWSGGAAIESTGQASVTFSFTGTSVRWIGARGRAGGKASVQVDGREVKQVNLFYRPNDEFRTPCFTIYDLTPGPHTLTIVATGDKDPEATGTKVWVDAFEVNPPVVSRLQEVDPAVTYSGTWDQAPGGLFWSNSGIGNPGEPEVGAKFTETKDASVTLSDADPQTGRHLNTRGTSISWVGYRGPDAGIALVSVDGGKPVEVDTYAPDFKVQEVLFTATGLEDKEHTLTITATGRKNIRSTAAKIFVDAFDVVKPGKRFEEDSPQVSYAAAPGKPWDPRNSRDWSEGLARTNSVAGSSATFTFNGTSVSWISTEKSTSGSATVFLDNEPPVEINMNKPLPLQGFQRTVFRKDGLTKGPHTLTIVVTSNDTTFVVVDAFDVVE
jgi:hypothetical protein